MKAIRIHVVVIGVALVGFFLLLALSSTVSAQAPGWKPPSLVVIGTTSTKAPGYAISQAMASVITKRSGVQFRVLPGPKTSDRALLLKQGRVNLSICTAVDLFFGLSGIEEFAEMGPQSLRFVWVGGPTTSGLAVKGDSEIKTWDDVRGKRVTSFPGYTVLHKYYVEGLLAFGGLTWDDVVAVPMSGSRAGQEAVLHGNADVGFMITSTAPSHELASSIHGIRWLEVPASDSKGWNRFHAISPMIMPCKVLRGAGIDPEHPAEVMGYDYPIVAYDSLSEDLVYWWVKQIHETYDQWKDTHVLLPGWTIDHALDVDRWYAPYHAGSIRYFKEIGKWTSEHEAKQKKLLAKYPQTMTR